MGHRDDHRVVGDMSSSGLARRLGVGDAVVIGLGSMIGAGVFSAFGPAARAADAGLLGAEAALAVLVSVVVMLADLRGVIGFSSGRVGLLRHRQCRRGDVASAAAAVATRIAPSRDRGLCGVDRHASDRGPHRRNRRAGHWRHRTLGHARAGSTSRFWLIISWIGKELPNVQLTIQANESHTFGQGI